jgi:hypothetical protein
MTIMSTNVARASTHQGLENSDSARTLKPQKATGYASCRNAGFKAIGIAAVASASRYSRAPVKSHDEPALDRARKLPAFLVSDSM